LNSHLVISPYITYIRHKAQKEKTGIN